MKDGPGGSLGMSLDVRDGDLKGRPMKTDTAENHRCSVVGFTTDLT